MKQEQLTSPTPTAKSLFWHDSILYNGALLTLIAFAMAWNPEIWLNDYPPDVKAKYGAMSTKAKQQGYLLALPLFIIMIGGVIWSTVRLRHQKGASLTFSEAYRHTVSMIFSFWSFDLLVIDWLIGVTWTPSRIVLPGTEGMAGYKDYGLHLRAHLRAAPALALVAALLAWIAQRIPTSK